METPREGYDIPREERTFFDFLQMQRRGMPPGMWDTIMERVGHSEKLLKTRIPTTLYLLTSGADDIKRMVGQKYDIGDVNDEKFMVVHVDDDWRLNAQVETNPPYHVYVSVNLFLYSARVGELLIGGLGLSADDGSSHHRPPFSVQQVGGALRNLVDGFIAGRIIPDKEHTLAPEYEVMHFIASFACMAFVIGHEFGHVIINEAHRRRVVPPFAGFAKQRMTPAFERLIDSRQHDPDRRVNLASLKKDELDEVYDAWMEEIIADVIGADSAVEYLSKVSLYKTLPGAEGFARMGVHFAMTAQLLYHVYRNYRDDTHAMVSKTHPPIDFRGYCVQRFLYGSQFLDVVGPWNEYAREVLRYVLSPRTGRPS